MLLEIETLVPREVTLVSMVNCWCAENLMVRGSGCKFFFKIYLILHRCAEIVVIRGGSERGERGF